MAKKGNLRVHQLAKKLGVTSKDIVAKCQAESIPGITNHMSTVSAGLAETVRSWFGDSAVSSAANETAAPVDIDKAREAGKKASRRRRASQKDDGAAEASVAVAEPPATADPPAATRKAAPTPPATPVATEAPAAPAAPEPDPAFEAPSVPETPPAQEPAAPAVAASADDPSEPPVSPSNDGGGGAVDPDDKNKPIMNVPDRPDSIKPAGPMLQQPVKTKLAGPKVIRVEKPDILPRPSGRGGGRPGGPRGGGAPPRGGRGAGMVPGDMMNVPMPGRGVGGGPGGAGAGRTSRRNKRRSASGRDEASRSARAGTPGSTGGENRGFNWREQDLLERQRRLNRSGGFFKANRRDSQKRAAGGARAKTAAQSGGAVKITEPITVKSLSAATGVKVNDILKRMLLAGNPTSINGQIETEAAVEMMADYNIELDVVEHKTAEEQIVEAFATRDRADERRRSPVVTILGHVDHGKTSLLDQIRSANVADGEAGGITQATSAFRVPVKVGDGEARLVTFIDTPGHEAFTEMRARGAKVTDVVVLVVAADDGVMPQTIESINHAQAAEVPIVVALNKIDKAEATDTNIQRILGQLAEHGLNPVEWGGSTEVVRTSALKGEGITDILEILDYQAELLELTADFDGAAEGTVIEAQLAEGRGPVARILVQEGCLRKGDFIAVGRAFGRVRDIVDDHGQRIDEAGPSTPVAISGISEVPDAGDKFYCVKNLKAAEAAAEERRDQERQRDLATEKVTLDNIFSKLAEGQRKELPLVVKADVQGSVETLKATLEKISNDDITISIKHCAVGGVSDADILLAETTGAIIIGFNVTTTSKVRKLADQKRIDIRLYDVIYDITDDVKKAAEGLLEPEYKLEVIGHAEVREVFKVSKVGMIAGCYVTDGSIERHAQIRVTRDGIVVEKDRRLEQLKRFKDDAKEVRSGQECGMRIEGYDDIKVGDVLECYKTLEVRRTLD